MFKQVKILSVTTPTICLPDLCRSHRKKHRSPLRRSRTVLVLAPCMRSPRCSIRVRCSSIINALFATVKGAPLSGSHSRCHCFYESPISSSQSLWSEEVASSSS